MDEFIVLLTNCFLAVLSSLDSLQVSDGLQWIREILLRCQPLQKCMYTVCVILLILLPAICCILRYWKILIFVFL